MPPKKPVRRSNNKKKNRDVPPSTTTNTTTSGGQLPQRASNASASVAATAMDTAFGGALYQTYKAATQRFKDGLAALVPVEIFAHNPRVHAMIDAVDYVVDHQIAVGRGLLEDCRMSLQLRKKYSNNLLETTRGQGGPDEGHEYIILVLNYCYQFLKPLVPNKERVMVGKERVQPSQSSSPFSRLAHLSLEDSDEEEEVDDQHVTQPSVPTRKSPPPRPQPPTTHEFTIQDLIRGTDRMRACMFLEAVDRAMEGIDFSYKTLKLNLRNLEDPDEDAILMMEDVMEAAVMTNFSIRYVQRLEEELRIDHPHLSTFYRIIACIFLCEIIDNLNQLARSHGSIIPKADLTAFIGDVVESCFRNPSDPENRLEDWVSTFCRKWSLPREEIKTKLVNGVVTVINLEIQPSFGSNQIPPELRSFLQAMDFKSHCWLIHKPSIGGDRDILNTHRMLQGLSNILGRCGSTKLAPLPGFFGPTWDERRQSSSRKIVGDMDELLMAEIMPELLVNCRHPLFSSPEFKMNELFPLMQLLRQYADNYKKPVPFALTFAVHAILTSLYVLQGHSDVSIIAKACKHVFNNFFDLLQVQLDSKLPCSTIWKPNLQMLIGVKDIAKPYSPTGTSKAEDHAFWNPCCAGMFLSFVLYQINFDAGSVMIDSFAQLRLVLHIYNALQQRNLISGNIPLLSSLDKFFHQVDAIWEGNKPKRDGIVKKFWIAYGTRADVVKRIHENCRKMVLQPQTLSSTTDGDIMKTRDGDPTRNMTACRAENFSKSYRRIYLDDFSGMVDRYEDLHTNVDTVPPWQLDFVNRVNDTLDLMVGEEELLSWNLIAVGGCLNEFLYYLMKKLGYQNMIDVSVATIPTGDRTMDGRRLHPRSYIASDAYKERNAMVWTISHKILGPLEFLEEEESVGNHPVLRMTRNCLIEYFGNLDPDHYLFFPTTTAGQGPKAATAVPMFENPLFAAYQGGGSGG